MEWLHSALDASDIGTFRWQITTNAIDSDGNLHRLFGLKPGASVHALDELLAQVHPDDRRRVTEACDRCAREGAVFDEEFRIAQDDGSTRWLHGKGRTAGGSDGTQLYVTGTCVDVSKRRHDEEALLIEESSLRESEARLRALVQDSPLGILMMDLEGHPIFYNPKSEEIHGIGLQEASGTGWVQAVHPEDRDRIAASWREAASHDRPWAHTYRFLHPDGRIVWVSGRAGPMYIDGKQVGFVGVLEDITSLKLAEEAVRCSEAKLRRIADSGMVGLIYWTANGDIAQANDKFLQMLGYRREELDNRGLNIHALTPERWHTLEEEKFAEVMTKGVASPWEQEFYASDGAAVPVLLVVATLDDTDLRGIAICLDVSERKKAEMERDRLLALEQQARRQAELATRARDEMMSVVAHDLRNPLHIFNIVLNRLLRRPPADSEDAARQFSMLQRSAQSMETLIHDLLDVSRIESGTFVIEKTDVSVEQLLSDVCELFEAPARERGIALSCDVAADAGCVMGDRARLTQVLWNLVGNALKFTPSQGRVTLRARDQDGFVQLSVEDTGSGIPTDHLPHIFDRFWQANRTSGAGAGLGLGLAVAKGIVEAHGGRIWVESAEGHGARFYFTISSRSH